MELGQDFAFLERQKKISIDSIDYKLDLLFYHRRLHRLFAIDLLMLDEQNIKVAQYLTVLPEKQWFIDKLNRSILIARELQGEKGE